MNAYTLEAVNGKLLMVDEFNVWSGQTSTRRVDTKFNTKFNMQKDLVKIKWFVLRTGASEKEAEFYLKLSKNKLEEAIRMRRFKQEK